MRCGGISGAECREGKGREEKRGEDECLSISVGLVIFGIKHMFMSSRVFQSNYAEVQQYRKFSRFSQKILHDIEHEL